jgi:hypothetical protein
LAVVGLASFLTRPVHGLKGGRVCLSAFICRLSNVADSKETDVAFRTAALQYDGTCKRAVRLHSLPSACSLYFTVLFNPPVVK